MKVGVSTGVPVSLDLIAPSGSKDIGFNDRVRCSIGDATVEIRDVGGQMVVVISNAKVSLEPRAAGIWINVEEA